MAPGRITLSVKGPGGLLFTKFQEDEYALALCFVDSGGPCAP